MKTSARAALLLTALLLLPTVAGAEAETSPERSPRRARLDLPFCPEPLFDRENLLAQLRLELLGLGVELTTDGESNFSINIDAPDCNPEDLLLRLEDSDRARQEQASLSLADRPVEERARVLALAVAELFRALSTDAEVELQPARDAETRAEDGSENEQPTSGDATDPRLDEERLRQIVRAEIEEARTDRSPRRETPEFRRGAFDTALMLRGYPLRNGVLFGGVVRLLFQPSERAPLLLTLSGDYGHGGGSANRGDVITQAAGGAIGFGVIGQLPRLAGRLLARLWMGRGWTEGVTSLEGVSTASGSSFLLELSLAGTLTVHISPRARLLFGASVGYVLVGLVPTSEGREVGGIAGPSFGLELGVELGMF